MAVPAKLVIDLWQVSQVVIVVGTWLLGLTTTVLVTAKLVPLAWQVVQPVVMPLWFMAVPANEVVDRWQVSHVVIVVGIWLLGLAKPAPPVTWQPAQPVVIPVWFIAAPPLNEVVELWQVSQAAVVDTWPVGFASAFKLVKLPL